MSPTHGTDELPQLSSLPLARRDAVLVQILDQILAASLQCLWQFSSCPQGRVATLAGCPVLRTSSTLELLEAGGSLQYDESPDRPTSGCSSLLNPHPAVCCRRKFSPLCFTGSQADDRNAELTRADCERPAVTGLRTAQLPNSTAGRLFITSGLGVSAGTSGHPRMKMCTVSRSHRTV